MTIIKINSTSEQPIEDSSEKVSIENIKLILEVFKTKGITFKRNQSMDKNGRYGFILEKNNNTVSVRMPGIPIDTEETETSFPRVYVNQSSWGLGIAMVLMEHELSK